MESSAGILLGWQVSQTVRYSGKWMSLADDRILEYLRENPSGAPKQMADSGVVRYSRQYISKRLNKLADHGLVLPLGNGVYQITERGEAYLDGELDTAEDRSDDPATGATAGTDQLSGPNAAENGHGSN